MSLNDDVKKQQNELFEKYARKMHENNRLKQSNQLEETKKIEEEKDDKEDFADF